MTTIEISKPEIRQEKSCRIDGLDTRYAEKLHDAVGDNGLIPVKLEQDVIIQRISHELYSDPQSGIRELLANEIRACHNAMKRHGAKPLIRVSMDTMTRELVIEGVDSEGIEEDRFLQVLSILGRSDNFDRTQPGKFGMGFASYTCLSDIIFVDTHARNGDCYSVMGKGGLGFQILDKPDMDHYGTRIRMTVRKDIKIKDLSTGIQQSLRLHGIDAVLTIDGNTHDIQKATISNLVSAEGGAKPGHHVVHLENDNIEVAINFSFHNHQPNDEKIEKTFANLVGMPIKHRLSNMYYRSIASIAYNIKNEEKFPPMPNRERFSNKVEKQIEAEIDKLVTEQLPKVKAQNICEFLANPHSPVITRYRNRIQGLDPDTARIAELISKGYYVDKYEHIQFIKNPSKVLIDKSGRGEKINAIYDHDDTMKIMLVYGKDNRQDYDDFVKYGIKPVTQYVKENKLRTVKHVRVYDLRNNSSKSYRVDQMPANVIVAGKEFLRLKETIRQADEIGHLATRASDTCGYGIDMKRFKEIAKNHIYNTSDGILTAGQILDTGKKVAYHKYKKTYNLMSTSSILRDNVIVVDCSKNRFELLLTVDAAEHLRTSHLLKDLEKSIDPDRWMNIGLLDALANSQLQNKSLLKYMNRIDNGRESAISLLEDIERDVLDWARKKDKAIQCAPMRACKRRKA